MPSNSGPGTEFLKDKFHSRFPMVENWENWLISNLRIRAPRNFRICDLRINHIKIADL
jgi:hypothetical protein